MPAVGCIGISLTTLVFPDDCPFIPREEQVGVFLFVLLRQRGVVKPERMLPQPRLCPSLCHIDVITKGHFQRSCCFVFFIARMPQYAPVLYWKHSVKAVLHPPVALFGVLVAKEMNMQHLFSRCA